MGITVIVLSCSVFTFAQQTTLKGKVIDAGNGKAIEYASLLNFSSHNRVYTNASGDFTLEVHTGDTLVLYAVGYYYSKIIVDASMVNSWETMRFALRQQAYEIAEVRIIGLGTYNEFKQQFIALDRPNTKTEQLASDLAEIAHAEGIAAYDEALRKGELPPPLIAVPILTPEEKERIVLAEIIKQKEVKDQVYQKYNPVLVRKVTGLTDDDTIIEFMYFCDFSDAYLLQVNDYELMVNIVRKYELFKKKKQEEKSIHNLLKPLEDFCFIA